MKKLGIAATAAVVLLALSVPASADISVWIGSLSGDDLLIESTRAYGGAVGFSFAKYFGVEVVFDWMPDSELPFDLEEVEELTGIDARVDLYSISGNFLVQYPAGQITPYFTVGYGVIGANAKAELADYNYDAWGVTKATNWGFGAKIQVAPWFAIRGDWRRFNLDLTVDDDIGDLLPSAVDNPSLSRLAIGGTITF